MSIFEAHHCWLMLGGVVLGTLWSLGLYHLGHRDGRKR